MNSARSRIMRYDWATTAWTELALDAAGTTTGHYIAVYLPGADVVLIGSSAIPGVERLNIIDNAGAWRTTAPPPAGVSCDGGTNRGPIMAHPSGNSAVLFSQDNGRIYEYDVAADVWTDRAGLPPELQSIRLIGGTVPELCAHVFVKDAEEYTTYLYRPAF